MEGGREVFVSSLTRTRSPNRERTGKDERPDKQQHPAARRTAVKLGEAGEVRETETDNGSSVAISPVGQAVLEHRRSHPQSRTNMDQSQLNTITNFIWNIADDVLRDVYVRGKYRDVIGAATSGRRAGAHEASRAGHESGP
jgi:hypothetical protein